MNFIKCEKLEKSMAELQFSIDAEAFKRLLPMFSRRKARSTLFPASVRARLPAL